MSKALTSRTLLLALVVPALSACGGGGSGGGIASAPTPPPTSNQTPTSPAQRPPNAFVPVVATIFTQPLANPELVTLGKGWQHEYDPNSSGTKTVQNARDAGKLTISYDQATGNYLVTAPLAGTGTLMRTEEYNDERTGFSAEPSVPGPTTNCCNTLGISAPDQLKTSYRYVSFVGLNATAIAGTNMNTAAYGSWAVVQPTKPGEVPTSGTARYDGGLFGYFAGDAGATWLDGSAKFDFDFGSGTLSGNLVASMSCFMGCTYDSQIYTFKNTQFSRGSPSFSGALTTPGTATEGSFYGIFAGPSASELAAQFELPFYNPEHRAWATAAGTIAAKRE